MDNIEKKVHKYINNKIKKWTIADLSNIPNSLKLIKEVHKKYGNFGSDIAKVHLGKIYEKTLGGKALLL